jgi:hypothetical protein
MDEATELEVSTLYERADGYVPRERVRVALQERNQGLRFAAEAERWSGLVKASMERRALACLLIADDLYPGILDASRRKSENL